MIYRPDTELPSHYFQSSLPRQFDEYVWFDETSPVAPIPVPPVKGDPDTFPFAL